MCGAAPILGGMFGKKAKGAGMAALSPSAAIVNSLFGKKKNRPTPTAPTQGIA